MRRSGEGMPTSWSSSMPRCHASRFDIRRWVVRASTSWSPMVKTGVSEVRGSWKIIARPLPRIADICLSFLPMSSWPSNMIDPVTLAFSSRRPMIASDVTDLPEPDSPTMPSVRPGSRSKLTPRTASTVPASEAKLTRRSRTERSASVMPGLLPQTWDRGRRAGRRPRAPSRRSGASALPPGSRTATARS